MILIILMAIIYAAGRGADMWTSVRGLYYNTTEGNKLWRDKYGNFSLTKNLIASIALGVAIVIAAVYVDYLWTMFLPFAFGSWYVALANYRLQNANRVKQTEFLKDLLRIQNEGGTEVDLWVAFNEELMVTASGRTWYQQFAWIWELGEAVDVRATLVRRIADVALLPPAQWFPR